MMMAAGVKNEKSSAALLYFLIPKGAILIGTKEEILNSWLKNFQDVKEETFLLFKLVSIFILLQYYFKETSPKGLVWLSKCPHSLLTSYKSFLCSDHIMLATCDCRFLFQVVKLGQVLKCQTTTQIFIIASVHNVGTFFTKKSCPSCRVLLQKSLFFIVVRSKWV